jgi:hypothetical protein
LLCSWLLRCLPAVACASIWLAYGLFAGFPNLIFVMGACVVVTFLVLFTAELLSMVGVACIDSKSRKFGSIAAVAASLVQYSLIACVAGTRMQYRLYRCTGMRHTYIIVHILPPDCSQVRVTGMTFSIKHCHEYVW